MVDKIRIEMDIYEAGVVSGILLLSASAFKEDKDPLLRLSPALRVYERIHTAVNEMEAKDKQ